VRLQLTLGFGRQIGSGFGFGVDLGRLLSTAPGALPSARTRWHRGQTQA
jgi:hypothetical protein